MALLLSGVAFTGCGDDVTRNAPFDNKVYIDAASKTETMPLKNSFRETTRTMRPFPNLPGRMSTWNSVSILRWPPPTIRLITITPNRWGRSFTNFSTERRC